MRAGLSEQVEIEVLQGLQGISAAQWDACANPSQGLPTENPFLTHRFLSALEESGSVGRGTGWMPHHLIARQDNEVIGVMPLYLKSHSQGEYIFDHNWAHALENAGGFYYPKLQCAVPFTPASGRRVLTAQAKEEIAFPALIGGAVSLADNNNISSLHITFCTENEWAAGAELGMMQRLSQQFHWQNRGYGDFDAFLKDLSSRKRKNIRKERRSAHAFGGDILQLTGDALRPEHWDAFWSFYQDTGSRKWGRPYLSRAFFDLVQERMRDDVLLVLARRGDDFVAGALNFIGADALYGRYWGCIEDHPCLHFELCYYQAIEFAISRGLGRVEAGAQGEHKLARGYLPEPCYSLHWIANPNFREAVSHYLEHEREAIGEDIEILADYGPFRNENGGA